MKRWSIVALNLLAVALAGFGCSGMQSGRIDGGWATLLDGTSGMENWNRVGDANWRAEDGAIVADKKTGKANGFLMTKNSYSDFQVRIFYGYRRII